MKVLAADTGTDINTVALVEDERVLAETVVCCPRRHAERLLETIDWVLREAGCRQEDIDCLAIAKGPGSFTGLRVGISTFKGLALAWRKPLIGVSTLGAMASQVVYYEEKLICPLLDARMKEIFAAAYYYSKGRRITRVPECVVSIQEFLNSIKGEHHPVFLGEGAVLYAAQIRDLFPQAVILDKMQYPRACAVAWESMDIISNDFPEDMAAPQDTAALLRPVYLRKSQAEIAAAKQRS